LKEIKILSIAGRSLWLAHRLCRMGFKVRFYDVTEDLGPVSPEDQDGPFLIRKEEGLDPLFLSFFEDQKDLRFLEDGFCLSSPSGNLSASSPNYEMSVQAFKENFYTQAARESSFWYDDFLRSFGKVRFKLSSEWKDESSVFNLKGQFFVRCSHELSHPQRLSLITKRGVSVESVNSVTVKDILSEIKKDFKDWIIDLTITELKLFTGNSIGALDQQLGWTRKRFKIEDLEFKEKLSGLPTWSLWVNSFYKTWKQDNCYIVIKSLDERFLDLWTIEQVYDPKKIKESYKMAESFLNQNFPYVSFTLYETSDFSSNLNTLFPISTGYSEINDTRYMWNSPREWNGFNSELIFSYQTEFSKWLSKNLLNEVKNDITL
jgi:hypothetical protein